MIYFVLFTLKIVLGADYFDLIDSKMENSQCKTGSYQSPININATNTVCDNTMQFTLEFADEDMRIYMEKTEYNIKSPIHFAKLYATDMDGKMYGYTGTSFHFHSPSEHTIDGKHFDLEMEMHLRLNKEYNSLDYQQQLAIVSVFFTLSEENKQPFFDHYDFDRIEENDYQDSIITVNPNLIGDQLNLDSYYYYIGSQTTPPCKEEVNWYILTEPLPIEQWQLDSFNQYFSYNESFNLGDGNNRRIQKLHGRTIKSKTPGCNESGTHFTQDLLMFLMYLVVILVIYKFV